MTAGHPVFTPCQTVSAQCARVHAHALASSAAAAMAAASPAVGAEELAPTPPLNGRRASAWRAVGYAFGSRGSGTPESARGGAGQATPPVGTGTSRPRTPAGTPPEAVVSVEQLESALSMSSCAIRCVRVSQRSMWLPNVAQSAQPCCAPLPLVPVPSATCVPWVSDFEPPVSQRRRAGQNAAHALEERNSALELRLHGVASDLTAARRALAARDDHVSQMAAELRAAKVCSTLKRV